MSNLHPGLYPGPNEISLGSKLPSQPFMGMLACHLLLEGTISLRNQLLHLQNPHTDTDRHTHTHTKGLFVIVRGWLLLKKAINIKQNYNNIFGLYALDPHWVLSPSTQ